MPASPCPRQIYVGGSCTFRILEIDLQEILATGDLEGSGTMVKPRLSTYFVD